MKTLNEHNAQRQEAHGSMNKPHANGIKCPQCSKELWDSNPMVILTSYPAQKNVHCPSCDYTGYRVA